MHIFFFFVRIAIDDQLRLEGEEDIFALGDCAANSALPLPTLAQVSNQYYQNGKMAE